MKLKRITPQIKAIADRHSNIVFTNGTFTNPRVENTEQVLEKLYAGETFETILEWAEDDTCGVGTKIMARSGFRTDAYVAGIRKSFNTLIQKWEAEIAKESSVLEDTK